jgi:hypothetical protein
MADSYRGRVFALYDMLFNVPFVIGAVVAAQIIPADGKSYPLIALAAAGYVLAALGYGLVSRHELLAGPSGEAAGGLPSSGDGEPAGPGDGGLRGAGPWPDTSPSASAHRRNS